LKFKNIFTQEFTFIQPLHSFSFQATDYLTMEAYQDVPNPNSKLCPISLFAVPLIPLEFNHVYHIIDFLKYLSTSFRNEHPNGPYTETSISTATFTKNKPFPNPLYPHQLSLSAVHPKTGSFESPVLFIFPIKLNFERSVLCYGKTV